MPFSVLSKCCEIQVTTGPSKILPVPTTHTGYEESRVSLLPVERIGRPFHVSIILMGGVGHVVVLWMHLIKFLEIPWIKSLLSFPSLPLLNRNASSGD